MRVESKEDAKALLDKYDTFLLDCDGVLWSGSKLLENTVEVLNLLRLHGKRLLFVTNNSMKSRQAYSAKFKSLGIDVDAREIFCSAYSSAVYLDKVVKFPKNRKVLVVGGKGISEELTEAGISWLNVDDMHFNVNFTDADAKRVHRDESIGCVLVGIDVGITYAKIAYAQAQLLDESTLFFATNKDTTFPQQDRLFPGAGAIIQAISACAGREPSEILGKPSKAMMDSIRASMDIDPKKTIMVGDRLDTDIAFGKSGGLATLLVLSGIHDEATAKESDYQPDYILKDLGTLYTLLK